MVVGTCILASQFTHALARKAGLSACHREIDLQRMTPRWRKGESNPRSLSPECVILAEEKGLRVDQVVKKGAIILRSAQLFGRIRPAW